MLRTVKALVLIALSAAALSGCDDDPTTLAAGAALLSVAPEGGASGVDPAAPVVLVFSHALAPAMADYAVLHQGDVAGPEVAGTWSLAADGTELVFTPETSLLPNTRYTIHVGGGMMDGQGRPVDLETHGPHMGGAWATGAMMGSGGMGGGMQGGGSGHMGEGWLHPHNGSYGMVSSFTTAL